VSETVGRDQAAIARMQALIVRIHEGDLRVVSMKDDDGGLEIKVGPPVRQPAPAVPPGCAAGTEGCEGCETDLTPTVDGKKCYLCGAPA
jgi:hypothetical protein